MPHFTIIADFASFLPDEVASLFARVLALGDGWGLIGREMFAIDGVKLPENPTKEKSGTRANFLARIARLEAAAQPILAHHRENDALAIIPSLGVTSV